MHGPSELRIVPMGVARYGETYQRRVDPRGRTYYWATNEPPPPPGTEETDLTAIRKGHVTLTALNFDMTHRDVLEQMRGWNLSLPK